MVGQALESLVLLEIYPCCDSKLTTSTSAIQHDSFVLRSTASVHKIHPVYQAAAGTSIITKLRSFDGDWEFIGALCVSACNIGCAAL